jgi:hypothetical protein
MARSHWGEEITTYDVEHNTTTLSLTCDIEWSLLICFEFALLFFLLV